MDFTCVRTWAGIVYTAFILDVFAQKIVAWNVAPTKAVELVDVPLRMALWQRGPPKHGSRLNFAAIELSALTRQCPPPRT